MTKTVAPTCVEKGYDLTYCTDCDTDEVKSNYTDVTVISMNILAQTVRALFINAASAVKQIFSLTHLLLFQALRTQ